jgi:DNA-binding GntR family transcriptional regulator
LQFESMMTDEVVRESFEEHRGIVAALVSKNPDEAERLMRHHILRSKELISNRPPDQFA